MIKEKLLNLTENWKMAGRNYTMISRERKISG